MKKISLAFLLFLGAKLVVANETIGLKKFTETMITLDPSIKQILFEFNQLEFITGLETASDHFVIDSKVQYSHQDSNEDRSVTTKVTRPLTWMGAKVDLSHSIENDDDRKTQTTSGTFEQRMIKNGFGRDERERKKSALYNKEAIEIEILEKYEARVEAIINLYFDYQLALIAVENAQKYLDDAAKLSSLVARKVRDSIASDTDSARANHEVLLRKAELDQRKNDLYRFESAVISISGKKIIPKSDVSSRNEKKFIRMMKGSSEKKDLRLTFLAAKGKSAEKKILLAERAYLPDFGLFLGTERDHETFGLQTEGQKFFVGMNFSMALGEDSLLAAKLQQARFEKSVIDLDRHQYLSERKMVFGQLLWAAEHHLRLIELEKKTLVKANKIAKGEQNRYQKGRIDLERLISSQNLVTSAHLRHLKQQINLRKIYLRWLAVTDSLIDGTKIVIPWKLLE